MNDREELIALRRLAELEAKAAKFKSSKDPAQPEGNYWDEVKGGIASAPINAYLGVKQMLPGGLDDTEKSVLQMNKEAASKAPIASFAGNVAMAAPTALIPGANTATGAGLIGAAQGLIQPADNAGERLINVGVGGVAGAGGQGLINGISKAAPMVYNMGQRAIAPFGSTDTKEKLLGELARYTAGERSGDVIKNLDNAQELIPGSKPTAGEVANNGGIAALQRWAASANPEAYSNRYMEQAAARKGALSSIAGDEDKLQKAIELRKSVSNGLYDKAGKQSLTVDDNLKSLLRSPEIQSAMKAARQDISPYVMNTKGVPMLDLATGAKLKGNVGVDQLHALKIQLDDAMNFNPSTVVDSVEKSKLMGAKSRLLDYLDNASPEYSAARQAHIDNSKPINQMQIGQSLLNKMKPALDKYENLGSETGAMFARALNDEKGNLVKSSTGGIKRKLSDVMEPEQMTLLKNLGKDLARKAKSQSMGRDGGSDTAQKLSMDAMAGGHGIPSNLSVLAQMIGPASKMSLLGRASNVLYDGPKQEMKSMLADALLNPKELARIMKTTGLDKPNIMKIIEGSKPVPYSLNKYLKAGSLASSLTVSGNQD